MKYSAGMLDLLEALTLPEQPVLFLKPMNVKRLNSVSPISVWKD